jgi:hypothetical protein
MDRPIILTTNKRQAIERHIRIYRASKSKDQPYFLIARNLAQDETLSWAARGVLAYLLSKPDDWVLQVPDLQQNCGRDRVYAMLKELITAGYITRDIVKDPVTHKMVSTDYYVHEHPVNLEKPLPEKPLPDFPDTAKPDRENTDSILYTETTKYREEQNTEKDFPQDKPAGEILIPSSVDKSPKPKRKRKAGISANPKVGELRDAMVELGMIDHYGRAGAVAHSLLEVFPDATAEQLKAFVADWKKTHNIDVPIGGQTLPDHFGKWKKTQPNGLNPTEKVVFSGAPVDTWVYVPPEEAP